MLLAEKDKDHRTEKQDGIPVCVLDMLISRTGLSVPECGGMLLLPDISFRLMQKNKAECGNHVLFLWKQTAPGKYSRQTAKREKEQELPERTEPENAIEPEKQWRRQDV